MNRSERSLGGRSLPGAVVVALVAGLASSASAATIGHAISTGTSFCASGVPPPTPAMWCRPAAAPSPASPPRRARRCRTAVGLPPASPGGGRQLPGGREDRRGAAFGYHDDPNRSGQHPRQAGDILGLYTVTDGSDCVYTDPASPGYIDTFGGDPNVGDTVVLGMSFPRHNLDESANLVPTGVTVACLPASVRAGQPVTCTATVTGSSRPSGTVTFASNSSGSFSPASCPLVLIGGNQARCSVTYTPATVGTGTHTVYANYSGDANNPPSHTSTRVTVVAGPSTTVAGCAPSTVGVGQATTCTVTVTGQSHPTGTVSFASNASGAFSAPSCPLVLIGGNQARCSVTYTPAAVAPTTQTIYADYSGDANNSPSHTSTTITVHV